MAAEPPYTADIPLAAPDPFAATYMVAQAELAQLASTTGPNRASPLQMARLDLAQAPAFSQEQELNQDILAHLDKAVADLDRDRWQFDLKPDMVLF